MLQIAVILSSLLWSGSSSTSTTDPNYLPDVLYSDHITLNHEALSSPIDIYSFNGILDVKLTTKVYRSVNDLFSFNTRAFCYNQICSVPGPTLHVKPAETIRYENFCYDTSLVRSSLISYLMCSSYLLAV